MAKAHSPALGAKFHHEKRKALLAAMEKESVALISAAEVTLPHFNSKYGWRQSAEFYYLTGIEYPSCTLLLVKSASYAEEEWLFIPQIDPEFERWEGAMLSATKAIESSGIKRIMFNQKLPAVLNLILDRVDNLYLQAPKSYLGYGQSAYELKIADLRKRFPAVEFKKASAILNRLRWVKDELEIKSIKQAIAITAAGLKSAALRVAPGVYEYQIEATLSYEYRNRGAARHAFTPIVGAGINATVLHYGDATEKIKKSDLVLIDTGAEWGRYPADVTRVFPADRKFSGEARDIYALNLEIQKAILAKLKPGQTMREIGAFSAEIQSEFLLKSKLVKDKKEVKNYTIHNIGHPLGLDVHDPPDLDRPLTAGCVITIEPGLYFPTKKIGVRIEDDILFTAKDTINLTSAIPKEIAQLEK